MTAEITQPLLIPNLDALRRKCANPPAGMDTLLARFRTQLAEDEAFRAPNIYLSALLGDADAIAQARAQVLERADYFATHNGEDGAIEHHTWCVAPGVLRTAVYYDWLRHAGGWDDAETLHVGQAMLHFCYEHAVSVLRSRTPSADNQSFSLALTCAICGYAFSNVPALAKRAQALHAYGMRRMAITLGLAPRDGYMHEGSTYQSHVVAPLAMWAATFLQQLQGPDAVAQRWGPVGGSLLNILRFETLLGSPGLLLPPWDNYGWQPKVNVAATALWASISGQTEVLQDAEAVWDRETYIAWCNDDRLWALIYWPEADLSPAPAAPLTGWALPETSAVIDDSARRSRLMLAWDQSTSWLQALGRAQVNPNHLMYELDGQPIFGDGMPDGPYLPLTAEEVAAPLDAETRALLLQQYGTLDNWLNAVHSGLLGGANTVLIDDAIGYFPLEGRHGTLCYEDRTPERHVITAESVDYYTPRFDLTRARRTIAASPSGLCWMVDDYRSDSAHCFTWQVYLRRGCVLGGERLHLTTATGQAVTLAWLPVERAYMEDVPNYPVQKWDWPDAGSERLCLCAQGTTAQFVVCLLPIEADLTVRADGPNRWVAEWPGGREEFSLPDGALGTCPPAAHAPDSWCDFDEAPFALSDESDEVLLARLESPAMEDWRRTQAAMQTLVMRGVADALPRIHRLLTDPTQRYLVHSVAAWCLGRTGYRPALNDLRARIHSPETNTALRSRWAVEKMEGVTI